MLKDWKIRILKARLKKAYQYLLELDDELGSSGGAHILSLISSKYQTAAMNVVLCFEALKPLDSKCPDCPAWIENAAGKHHYKEQDLEEELTKA